MSGSSAIYSPFVSAAAILSFGVSSALAATPISTASTDLFNLPNPTPSELAQQAYIWAYPFIVQKRTEARQNLFIPTNQFGRIQNLTTPSNRTVIRPNNDTLYALAFLNVSQRPLVLDVPATGNRYYSLHFQDAYTNTFRYIGTRLNDTTGGRYTIVGPSWTGALPPGLPVIQSPTDSVWLLARTIVEGLADLPAARAINNAYTLSYFPDPPTNLFPSIPVGGGPFEIPRSGLGFYTELNALLVNNPPPANEIPILQRFSAIGLGAGLTPTIDAATAEAAIAAAEALIDAEWTSGQTIVNNWATTYNAGEYGDDYLLRAAIGKYFFGINVAEEALYFSTALDGAGAPLTGERPYRLSFPAGGLPPVTPGGFWSLTLYGPDGFLVENPINRYSIGDRTPGLQYNPDGSLDIFLQNQPPVGWESNWLPAPTGLFNLSLRAYLPSPALLNGSYAVPAVDPVPVPESSPLWGMVVLLGTAFFGKRKVH